MMRNRIGSGVHTIGSVLATPADPDVRFRAASGGVLTALAAYLVESGKVSFILQVRASLDRPVPAETVMSEDGASVVRSTGSRYGPATPLASIMDALDRDEPFAFVGKPCDVGALRLLARKTVVSRVVARRCWRSSAAVRPNSARPVICWRNWGFEKTRSHCCDTADMGIRTHPDRNPRRPRIRKDLP